MQKEKTYDFITILGPTASGKTTLGVSLAHSLGGELISADSRQIYRGMDLGTGKDLNEYWVEGTRVPYHLIDIADPGYKYNVFEYQRDFLNAYNDIKARNKPVVLCGGTGLYLESVLKGYRLLPVPENKTLREKLKNKTLEELTTLLSQYKNLHNTTDVDTVKRAIRAIEIAEYYIQQPKEERSFPKLNSLIIGVDISREERRANISKRLKERLDSGMIDEVKGLINKGVKAEDLIYYGLEYKYLTQFIIGELSYEEMTKSLEIAIHQFAKRQMTWFRGMERKGFTIHWINANLSTNEKLKEIYKLY